MGKCLMDFDPMCNKEYVKLCFNGNACRTCGWNSDIHDARIEAIRDDGLKQNKKGLWYLPLSRRPKMTEETPLVNLALSLYSDVR